MDASIDGNLHLRLRNCTDVNSKKVPSANFFSDSSFLQDAIFRVIAAILHLGNIVFAKGKEIDSSVLKDDQSRFHLNMTAELLMYISYLSSLVPPLQLCVACSQLSGCRAAICFDAFLFYFQVRSSVPRKCID